MSMIKTPGKTNKAVNCDDCMHYSYDDDWECYTCDMDLDQDEMESFIRGTIKSCPFYDPGDEYTIVRHQM